MNFYFEMAINILEVTLILSFLVQYLHRLTRAHSPLPCAMDK